MLVYDNLDSYYGIKREKKMKIFDMLKGPVRKLWDAELAIEALRRPTIEQSVSEAPSDAREYRLVGLGDRIIEI